uniref:Uncharacterized protein n=1 Tax=Oncorhynchus tshawytscha TaxID=74940 RepID=A0A8C8BWU2_ONCTS
MSAARFPNTNQTQNCFQNHLGNNHNTFYICLSNKALLQEWYQRVYKSLCPLSWVRVPPSLIEAGSFPGKI